MTKSKGPAEGSSTGKILVDRKFLRAQAREAVETFFAPLAGVYAAAKGERLFVTRRRTKAKRAA